MSNKIRIKRRLKGSQEIGLPVLETGELAFDETKGKLYIGESDGSTVYPREIGGSGYLIPEITGIAVPKTRTITPGSGLYGTEALDLSSDRSLHIGQGTGIIIDGDNVNIDPAIRNITEIINVTSTIGGLSAGTQLTTASGITDILKKMLQQVSDPTITDQTFTISFAGNPTTSVEAGTVTNLTINANFSQGSVNGTGLTGSGAGWISTGFQGVRAGAATNYVINTINKGTSTSHSLGDVTAIDGAITYSKNNSSVTYGAGIVPKNSTGANSTLRTQLQGNTMTAASDLSYNGFRKLFYGTSSSVISNPTAAEIRGLSNSIPNPSVNTPNFNIVAPTGTRTIIIAIPSGAGYVNLANATLTVFDVPAQQLLNTAVSFSTSLVNVPAANGYVPTGYKVLTYVNNAPSITEGTYTIDLST